MKKLFCLVASVFFAFATIFNIPVNAQENSMPEYSLENNVPTITVPANMDEDLVKEQVQYLFDNTNFEVISVNYQYPQTRASNGKKENKKTFYYLSLLNFATIKATGEVYDNVWVKDFKVTVTTSGFPVVHDSTLYYARNNAGCYAMVKVTLSGAIPHTYTYKAPLLSEIYQYAG